MKVKITEILVGDRLRQPSLSKVAELAESISSIGLLQPIVIGANNQLIAGKHRLDACRSLGWEEIDCTVLVMDPLEAELAEVDENLKRNELTVLEQSEHIARREEILESMGLRAKASPGTNQYTKSSNEPLPIIESLSGGVVGDTVTPTKTTQDLAQEIGINPRSLQRRKQIAKKIEPEVKEALRETPIANSTTQLLEIARMPVEKQQEIVAKMESTGEWDIRKAKGEINREERIKKIAEISQRNQELTIDSPLAPEKFPVIYADPPWRYEHVKTDNRAIENQYPTMALDEICDLPVAGIATPDAILFLWTTSPKLAESMSVVDAWGFTYRTCAVWVKDRIGMGYYFRQQHELLLVCTRGSIPVPPVEARVSSVIHGDRLEHSAKPAVVAEIIEAMYPELPKVELFCRSPRPGWFVWGNQSRGT